MGITRKQQGMNRIYIQPDGTCFVSPDGEGRVWFDTVKEAREETGIVKTLQLADYASDE
jgi:hypothetical protein